MCCGKPEDMFSIPKGHANVDTSSIFLHSEEDANSLCCFFVDDSKYAKDEQ